MKTRLAQRLEELRSEFESGQKMLADLEARKAELQNTLLRISGAMQVLEELLKQEMEAEERAVDSDTVIDTATDTPGQDRPSDLSQHN